MSRVNYICRFLLPQSEMLPKDQPGISHQTVVVEGDADAVGMVKR